MQWDDVSSKLIDALCAMYLKVRGGKKGMQASLCRRSLIEWKGKGGGGSIILSTGSMTFDNSSARASPARRRVLGEEDVDKQELYRIVAG